MKRWLFCGTLLVVATTIVAAAEERFSAALPAEAFAASGLSKLTPEELARLDALVRDYKSGALASAQRELEAARARAAKAEADARAADAAATAAQAKAAESEKKPGLIERAKVLLNPGTKIEYATLQTRLTEPFRGWRRGTVFILENGQRWRVVEGEYVTPPMPAMPVKVEPGVLGSFWMSFEGVRQRAKVESLDAK